MHADVVLQRRYRLEALLGEGGMGSVWRAHDLELGRTVAVKQVRLAGLPDAQADAACRRTLREAQIASRLHHPNVITVFDVLRIRNDSTGREEPWLVLEYVPSRTLAETLRDDGPLVPREAAAVGEQIAAALDAAHAEGIVHRDVKPGNILIASARPGHPARVKLTDFGISHAPGAADITGTGVISGTPAYFAPETARTGRTDARSDVYSLGATLHEAVEGEPPFGRSFEHVHEPQETQPGMPSAIHRTAPRATQPDVLPAAHSVAAPATQPYMPAATRSDERPVAQPDPPPAAQPDPSPVAPPDEPPGPTGRRRRRLAGVVTAVVLAAAAITGLIAWNGSGPRAVVLDDPRTADACSLLAPAALQAFGPPHGDAYRGPFPVCRADVGQNLAVELEFREPAEEAIGGSPEQLGEVTLFRMPPDAATHTCSRAIELTDRNLVWITATDLARTSPVDLCAVAESAARGAAGVLAGPGIGVREPLDTTKALARIDTCTLLTPTDLDDPPGMDLAPDTELGGWSCSWHNATNPDAPSVEIAYHHQAPLAFGTDGEPVAVGGRTAFRAEHDDRCVVTIPQRSFLGDGRPRLETVHLEVADAAGDPCGRATTLAETVVSRLPPPS
jgi:hypothetical protein